MRLGTHHRRDPLRLLPSGPGRVRGTSRVPKPQGPIITSVTEKLKGLMQPASSLRKMASEVSVIEKSVWNIFSKLPKKEIWPALCLEGHASALFKTPSKYLARSAAEKPTLGDAYNK